MKIALNYKQTFERDYISKIKLNKRTYIIYIYIISFGIRYGARDLTGY